MTSDNPASCKVMKESRFNGMRIAYLTGEYPRATDTFIQREVAALRERGVEVQTFSVRHPAIQENVGADQDAERQRTKYLLPCSPVTLFVTHGRLLFTRPACYLGALKLALKTRAPGIRALIYQLFYFAEAAVLARHMNLLGIPHLHNHFANSSCTVAMIAAKMGGFTYSFTIHGPAIFFEPRYWRIDEKIRRALFVSCISYYCRSQAMIFAPIECWERLHIVHCGVDPEYYPLTNHQGEGYRLLFVGRVAAVKGLPILLKALAIIRERRPNIILTVVGDGPDRAVLEAMAADLGVKNNVCFVGYRTREEVRDYLIQSDLFVLSSFAEGVPVVLMEAMVAGVPVVATRIAGVSELVEDAISGYTVPPGDHCALAKKIEILLSDGFLRKRFGEAGRQQVKNNFNIRKEAARLHYIIGEALRGGIVPVRPDAE